MTQFSRSKKKILSIKKLSVYLNKFHTNLAVAYILLFVLFSITI